MGSFSYGSQKDQTLNCDTTISMSRIEGKSEAISLDNSSGASVNGRPGFARVSDTSAIALKEQMDQLKRIVEENPDFSLKSLFKIVSVSPKAFKELISKMSENPQMPFVGLINGWFDSLRKV